MDWIKERLKEKTTYRGLAMLLASVGVGIDPALVELIGAGLLGLLGLIEAGSKDESVNAG
ncbi:MAG: hypothetical protein HRU20_30155 [Pseudomonadales bacterium]|nr:hypothetical protein [Pseudomonadales bacterium]